MEIRQKETERDETNAYVDLCVKLSMMIDFFFYLLRSMSSFIYGDLFIFLSMEIYVFFYLWRSDRKRLNVMKQASHDQPIWIYIYIYVLVLYIVQCGAIRWEQLQNLQFSEDYTF